MNPIKRDQQDPTELTNWNGSDTTRPAVEVTPASVDELVAIVQNTTEFPSPVRAAGHLHSTNPCFSTNQLDRPDVRLGTLVQMRPGFSDIRVESSGNEVFVRAGAGAKLIAIRDKLRPDRELRVSPEIGNATVGSVACGGTKDSTLPVSQSNLSQISSLVVEAKLVDARGKKIRVHEGGAEVISEPGTPTLPPNLDLRALRSSYGLLGILYEVTVQTVERVPIETRYEWMPFPGAPRPAPNQIPDVGAVFAGADAVLGFLQPYHGGLLVERRTKKKGATITTEDRIRRALRDWIWEWGVSQATTAADALADPDPSQAFAKLMRAFVDFAKASTQDNPLTRELVGSGIGTGAGAQALIASVIRLPHLPAAVTQALNVAGKLFQQTTAASGVDVYQLLLKALDKAPRLVFDAIREFTACRSDSMLDFVQPPDRKTTFDFTFWLFPVKTWQQTMSEYLNFCHDVLDGKILDKGAKFRPALFTQVYFMGEDHTSQLSPCPTPAFSLDVAHNGSVQTDLWRQFNEKYNVWAADHDGRPLLNQTKQLESMPNVKTLVLNRAFGPDWPAFAAMVARADPQRRFLSDFFGRLL
jgi:hypothetical protein